MLLCKFASFPVLRRRAFEASRIDASCGTVSTMDEALHAAAGIGAYRWGSLLLETSSLAPANGRIIVEALAGAVGGGFITESEAHLRATIAVLHELVHLQQDLATGLGAWDHLVDRVAYPRIVNQSRWFIWKHTQPPYRAAVEQALNELGASEFTDQVRSDLDAVRQQTVGRRQLMGGAWDTPPVKAAFQRILGNRVKLRTAPSLRIMFEGEAAALTLLHIAGSRFDEVGLEWLGESAVFWNIVQMSDEYQTALFDVAEAWLNHPVSPDDIADGLTSFLSLVAWVVDLASAYPPPSLLEEWQGDAAEFDPVFRYLRILEALNALDEDRGQRLLVAVVGGHWGDGEAILRQNSELPYPSSALVYERWLAELQPLLNSDDWDSPLFRLRAAALQSRLEGSLPKGIGAIMSGSEPVQVMVQGVGLRGILHGAQNLDNKIVGALLARRSDMELFDLFHDSGRFRCPYGRANVCPAAQEECLTGITLVTGLPITGCKVRSELKEMGYAI